MRKSVSAAGEEWPAAFDCDRCTYLPLQAAEPQGVVVLEGAHLIALKMSRLSGLLNSSAIRNAASAALRSAGGCLSRPHSLALAPLAMASTIAHVDAQDHDATLQPNTTHCMSFPA